MCNEEWDNDLMIIRVIAESAVCVGAQQVITS